MSDKTKYLPLICLPLIVGGVLVAIEVYFVGQDGVEDALEGQVPETLRQVLTLNNDLAKLFISLSTAVIGGVAYYLKFAYKEFGEHTVSSRVIAAGTLFFAGVSIFFGHLWVGGMRNQLANDYFNYARPELVWPERLQYFSFIVALCWFAVLAFEQERVRTRSAPSEEKKQQDTRPESGSA